MECKATDTHLPSFHLASFQLPSSRILLYHKNISSDAISSNELVRKSPAGWGGGTGQRVSSHIDAQDRERERAESAQSHRYRMERERCLREHLTFRR